MKRIELKGMKLELTLIGIVLLVLCSMMVNAQGFVSRTNDVHLNFKEAPVNAPLPTIEWISPTMESTFSKQYELKIEVMVTSNVPMKEVKLVVTTPSGSREKKFPLEEGELSKVIKQNMTLVDGENVLQMVVVNEKGGTVSSSRSILIGKDAITDAVDANRKDYALIFAIDKYDHWDDLVNPINDARSIETVLKQKYNFQTEVVENATIEEVLAKLYDYNTKKFNAQDQLFIFFAGHGYFDETLGEGYVVASNSLLNDKGKTTYIPHTVLRQRVDNIKCEHIFLAMDVCFGGTIDPILAKSRSGDVYAEATDEEYLVRKLSKRTRKFLTSGSKEYVSDGIQGKHSPFAAKFIQALREVGAGNDRILTLTEMQVYFLKLPTEPRSGSFGSDDPASDFVFVAGKN